MSVQTFEAANRRTLALRKASLVDAESSPARNQASYRYYPLPLVLAAVCLGILLDWLTSFAGWWVISAALLAVWTLHFSRNWMQLASITLLLSVTAASAAWRQDRWSIFAADEISRYARDAPQPICMEVIALSAPRRMPAPRFDPLRATQLGERSRLEIKAVALRDGEHWRPCSGRATLLVQGHLLGVGAGDRLKLYAMLSRIAPAANPGEFDYAEHARGDRQLCLLRGETPDCVTVLSTGSAWAPRRILDNLRTRGDRLLWRHLNQQRSGLAAALLLGVREELDAERSEAFFETGTIHILAISGMHIAILAGALFFSLRFGLLPRGIALLAVAASTVLYTVVTDSQPSAVRAAVVIVLLCLAQYLGRKPAAVNCLAAAAIVVLLLNPADMFRVGPQLSFLAVATLIWLSRHWSRQAPVDPLTRLIAETRPWPVRAAKATMIWTGRLALASFAIWLVESPLILSRFHLVSPAAVVLTVLSAIPVTVALMSGFGVLLLGWIIPPLAAICGWVCDANLRLLDGMMGIAAEAPGSHFWLPGAGNFWLVGIYGLLAGIVLLPRHIYGRRMLVALLALWIGWGLAMPWLPRGLIDSGPGQVRCTFLSVGHGCAVVVEQSDGKTLLYDAGRLGSPHRAAQAISGYLWSRQHIRLDAIVLSHADVDHYNAVPELLDRFSVGAVYVSPGMFAQRSAATETLRVAIERAGVRIVEVAAGDSLPGFDQLQLSVLHPSQGDSPSGDNDQSVVLLLKHAGRTVLLTGDLEARGLSKLLSHRPIDCDVLLAPHHGSPHSDPAGCAAWSTPEVVVISGDNAQHHPFVVEAYESQGARLLHTANTGAAMLEINRDRIRVQCWHPDGSAGKQ